MFVDFCLFARLADLCRLDSVKRPKFGLENVMKYSAYLKKLFCPSAIHENSTPAVPSENDAEEAYSPPTILIHDADEFVRSLGPAQACTPSPDLF